MNNDFLFNNFDNSNFHKYNDIKAKTLRKKRFKSYTPDDHTFLHLDPEKMFPNGSFERFIIDTVNQLNLEKFEYSQQEDLGGNEEYNPKAILGLLFYGYANGIFHSRKLESLCKHDIRYMFISGHATPEHSTISRFIIKYSKEIKELFAQILYIAIKSKYVSYKMIVIDGTKIKANAGEKFNGTIEDFKKKRKHLEKKIQEAINKQNASDKKEEAGYWKNKEERYKKEKEKITGFLEQAHEVYTKANNEVKQNITDNDSRIMKEGGKGFIQGYNSQISVCEKNAIIVASSVNNNAADKEQFKVMVEETIKTASEYKKKLKKGKWISDNGYYSTENIIYCDKENIDAYISYKQDKKIYLEEENPQEIELKNGCRMKGENIYCYGNKKLKLKRKRRSEGEIYCIYGIEDLKRCENCSKFDECVGKNKNKEFWVKDKILKNIDKIINMRNKLRTKEGNMIYSRRMATIEKIFGYIKGILNFSRYTLRSIKKVEVQWKLLCSVYNIKRLYSLKYGN